jgi:hypothetical protein
MFTVINLEDLTITDIERQNSLFAVEDVALWHHENISPLDVEIVRFAVWNKETETFEFFDVDIYEDGYMADDSFLMNEPVVDCIEVTPSDDEVQLARELLEEV